MNKYSKGNILAALKEGMVKIGFKNVDEEDGCVVYSIDTSFTDEERKYLIFDVYLSTVHENKFVNIRTYYSINQDKYKFRKLYHKYLLSFINRANRKIRVGGLYFESFSFCVYLEINQVLQKELIDLQKLCARLTDEVVIIMSSYGKALYALKTYLKSIKTHLKKQKKQKVPIKGLNSEIELNIKSFIKDAKNRYEFLNKKELSFSKTIQCKLKNRKKQIKIYKILKSDIQLQSLMMFSKYIVTENSPETPKVENNEPESSKEEIKNHLVPKTHPEIELKNTNSESDPFKQPISRPINPKEHPDILKVPNYEIRSPKQGNSPGLPEIDLDYLSLYPHKYSSLTSTLRKKPELIQVFQGLLLKLLDSGLKIKINSGSLFDSFITSHDEFIHLKLSKEHQLTDLLEEANEAEINAIRSGYLIDIHDFIFENLLPCENLDFMVMKTDFSGLLAKINT